MDQAANTNAKKVNKNVQRMAHRESLSRSFQYLVQVYNVGLENEKRRNDKGCDDKPSVFTITALGVVSELRGGEVPYAQEGPCIQRNRLVASAECCRSCTIPFASALAHTSSTRGTFL